ncbi:hypothetical protein B0H19DRAFT_1080176 [Mycena capillaripes]|nr:hypothetical protein B0H19DRAFT_1080176 [Mycena capillaripes]
MFSHFFRHALALLVLSSAVSSQKAPTYSPSPFSDIGTIDSMTFNSADGPLGGGTIAVNGFPMTVPKNTLVTLPSITVAWSEMFVNGQPNLPLLGSVSWEATVFGNVVGGKKIVGLLYINQESTQILQGFITSIDFTTGKFVVDGALTCVLNDPLGRYGHPYTAYPLWSVDPDNPSVRSSTGFPLCIPRNSTDSECPLTNRPVDNNKNYLTTFTFPDPAKVVNPGPDPRIMAPLAVGDYITFSGIKTPDGTLAIYSLEANLGIYTAKGTQPAYITVESANYGIVDPNPNLEIGETRAVAFATDPSVTVQWFAMDVDPCTGDVTERNLLLAQGSSVAPVGKITYRLGKIDASPAPRQVGFRYSSGTSPGPRGIIAGQFIQPIFDYIFPELLVFGGQQIPLEFDVVPFLAQGSGPFVPGTPGAADLTSPLIVGQLSPWPGSAAPKTTTCPPPSTAPAAPATPAAPVTPAKPAGTKDTVTIISATTRNTKGQTTTSVTASSNNASAKLSMAITGVDNVAATPMNRQANGQYQLDISTKGKPASVTITSDQGGSASKNV